MDAIQSEIDSRGFSYNFTRDAVLSYTLLRAEAYARNASLGNYGAATFHGTMGVIDSFGYALYGDTPGETGRNFAISLVLGATFSRLAAAGRAAQLESAASRELIAARLASRRAALTPPEPITPPRIWKPLQLYHLQKHLYRQALPLFLLQRYLLLGQVGEQVQPLIQKLHLQVEQELLQLL
ncbi:MAG: hypothetical protein IPP79_19755 [Chitinophagaceae bacterium]|nr:hypothetical protein [Chitinophagaceae bacterium]